MRELQVKVQSHTYNSIESSTEGEYVAKGSKFLSYAIPVNSIEEIKFYLDEVKQAHPKAVHHCYAYRLSNLEYRANDDGEPSGTAGRPILGQLNSKNLTNVIVIVVRYFGGVLLGTNGLISAYKQATQEALNKANIISCEFASRYVLTFAYQYVETVMAFLKRHHIIIHSKTLDLDCTFEVELPRKYEEQFIQTFSSTVTISKI